MASSRRRRHKRTSALFSVWGWWCCCFMSLIAKTFGSDAPAPLSDLFLTELSMRKLVKNWQKENFEKYETHSYETEPYWWNKEEFLEEACPIARELARQEKFSFPHPTRREMCTSFINDNNKSFSMADYYISARPSSNKTFSAFDYVCAKISPSLKAALNRLDAVEQNSFHLNDKFEEEIYKSNLIELCESRFRCCISFGVEKRYERLKALLKTRIKDNMEGWFHVEIKMENPDTESKTEGQQRPDDNGKDPRIIIKIIAHQFKDDLFTETSRWDYDGEYMWKEGELYPIKKVKKFVDDDHGSFDDDEETSEKLGSDKSRWEAGAEATTTYKPIRTKSQGVKYIKEINSESFVRKTSVSNETLPPVEFKWNFYWHSRNGVQATMEGRVSVKDPDNEVKDRWLFAEAVFDNKTKVESESLARIFVFDGERKLRILDKKEVNRRDVRAKWWNETAMYNEPNISLQHALKDQKLSKIFFSLGFEREFVERQNPKKPWQLSKSKRCIFGYISKKDRGGFVVTMNHPMPRRIAAATATTTATTTAIATATTASTTDCALSTSLNRDNTGNADLTDPRRRNRITARRRLSRVPEETCTSLPEGTNNGKKKEYTADELSKCLSLTQVLGESNSNSISKDTADELSKSISLVQLEGKPDSNSKSVDSKPHIASAGIIFLAVIIVFALAQRQYQFFFKNT